MLSLEPRASDDETLESEASIGTADSSENLNMDSEGTTSDFSGRSGSFDAGCPPIHDSWDRLQNPPHYPEMTVNTISCRRWLDIT